MHLIYEHMMFNMLNNMICGKHIFAKDICNVVTGKEDANFATENGKYKFFTCASTPSLCDEYVFESKSILIAGNGEFNVKHYDENLTHIKELMYCLQNLNYMDYCISQAYTE